MSLKRVIKLHEEQDQIERAGKHLDYLHLNMNTCLPVEIAGTGGSATVQLLHVASVSKEKR
jgi:hypothetical protein